MRKTLVFGASGQLGQCLQYLTEQQGSSNFVYPQEEGANILDIEGLRKIFQEENPQFVINCAAYTAVDKAEDDVEICRKVNKEGAANLALLCHEFGSVLIHVSTDFVFEGNIPVLLTETDEANPINIYGLTKLEGEQDVSRILDQHFIIRTSWLYSEYGNNFVKTMLRLGKERDELRIIADQIGTPTYAIDLADCILQIISSGVKKYGVYHFSNEGVTSWYDFAKGIFDLAGLPVKVIPISTSEYPTRATRPHFSVMDKRKIKSTLGIEIPYWRDSLNVCISRLKDINNNPSK